MKSIRGKVTTKELLRREWDIVCMAHDGIGRFGPHSSSHSIQNSELDGEQRQAVERILRSRDFVTLFRGGAGPARVTRYEKYTVHSNRPGMESR